MSQDRYDLAIIGSGIVGLAHAWSAAERGLRVIVFDRSHRPEGASIRNFGMVWPIGQSAGFNLQSALLSRDRWLFLKENSDIWVNPCGSLHLAHAADEWAVLNEFAEDAQENGYDCRLLNREETLSKSKGVNSEGLRGSLWSPTELCVDPRAALSQLPPWLEASHQVQFQFETHISQVKSGVIQAANGQSWRAEKTLICNGADFQSLFPDFFENSPMTRCKLQMMATGPQPKNWRVGPHLASGLTLRHYQNFESCPSLESVKRRFGEENPLFDQFGIHVMASQGSDGSIILGDSHEYDDDIDPFRKSVIDEIILKEAKRIFQLENWTITRRWDGIYAKTPGESHYSRAITKNVRVFTGLGGAGMTMSFGLAEHYWNHWLAASSLFNEESETELKITAGIGEAL
ncbi:MAG: TIGR03364 family FAD-dependent oxidoreductase [Planctomycetota bacterium]|nr:TIGR03364 family FAD-dependent oxidoreductase [Planctomycetota bacterium]